MKIKLLAIAFLFMTQSCVNQGVSVRDVAAGSNDSDVIDNLLEGSEETTDLYLNKEDRAGKGGFLRKGPLDLNICELEEKKREKVQIKIEEIILMLQGRIEALSVCLDGNGGDLEVCREKLKETLGKKRKKKGKKKGEESKDKSELTGEQVLERLDGRLEKLNDVLEQLENC